MNKAYSRRALTLLELIVSIAIIGLVLSLVLPAVQHVRHASMRANCQNRIRQLPMAIQSYHDVYRSFPPGTTPSAKVEQFGFLNWHTRLLPFLEQNQIWEDVRRAYAIIPYFWFNPPHVHRMTIIPSFVCPADDRAGRLGTAPNGSRVAFTTYLGVNGTSARDKDGVLFLNSKVCIVDVSDGMSNTSLVGERPPSADERYAWWYAGIGQSFNGDCDATLGVRAQRTSSHENDVRCFAGPYRFGPGNVDNQCDAFHFWSHHPGGAHFAFCDGSVRFLAYSADPLLPALATRAGGEAVQVPE